LQREKDFALHPEKNRTLRFVIGPRCSSGLVQIRCAVRLKLSVLSFDEHHFLGMPQGPRQTGFAMGLSKPSNK
jgi:hypothetical protein